MSEMELLKRIEELEKKNLALEETISTIELMEKSERISDFLNDRKLEQFTYLWCQQR